MRYKWVLIALISACSAPPPDVPDETRKDVGAGEVPKTNEQRLSEAWQAFASSDYGAAGSVFEELKDAQCCGAAARLGLLEVAFVEGRYDDAIGFAAGLGKAKAQTRDGVSERERVLYLQAASLRALGKRDAAEAALRAAVSSWPEADTRSLRVALGETLIDSGRRREAEPVLMTLIEEYNSDVVSDADGEAMLWVARAAGLLRSPEDANDAYNAVEKALGYHEAVLLARAVLYLDNYDPGHAEEVLSEVLDKAPRQPLALVRMAEVRLAQAMDFGEAERLAKRALTVNPRLGRAQFILAGIALRDMKLEEARAHVARGLETNPDDLELLSMLGAVEFLADDEAAFQRVKARVLELNAEYSRFHQVVADYADWEHRYEKIVELMREAVAIDPEDAKAFAQLGLNLIRSGSDEQGISALRRAYAKDPFNVRVVNTLNLYEQVIPQHYASEREGNFVFRYPKAEKAVLSRYIPQLMNRAWNQMKAAYRYTPDTPVGIELYYEREHFAVRTSGLPQIAIQGVCFGKTLASMSPRVERFNVGMTLWHELAHVFHIQLSKSHVPRWFTEGLAEYETLVERPEWKRERDADLYAAVKAQRLPKIGAMNEAFTHAESLKDVTVAYYASTQIVTLLAEEFGREKLRAMLVAWGEGKRSEQVFREVLGLTSDQLDQRFAAYLDQRLSRFAGQFFPDERVGDPEVLRTRVNEHPDDADAKVKMTRFFLQQGDVDAARGMLKLALKVDAKNPQALWLKAQFAIEEGERQKALLAVEKLLAAGYDGYQVRLLQAKVLDPEKQGKAVEQALEAAHRFDPEEEAPLFGLLRMAATRSDAASEMKWLKSLAALAEHDGAILRRLVQLLSESGEHEKAIEYGRSTLFADLEAVQTHLVLAKAFEAAGKFADAEHEFESAVVCPASAQELASAHAEFAAYLGRRGRSKLAQEHLEEARRLSGGDGNPR